MREIIEETGLAVKVTRLPTKPFGGIMSMLDMNDGFGCPAQLHACQLDLPAIVRILVKPNVLVESPNGVVNVPANGQTTTASARICFATHRFIKTPSVSGCFAQL
jgi:hypothetical protein